MRAVVAIACVVLAGCSREEQPANDVDLNAAAMQAQGDIDNYAARRSPRMAVASAAPQSVRVEMPAAVVKRYYALIGARRFGEAWALWADRGAACGVTTGQFAANQAGVSAVAVDVGPEQDPEAGAGQRYVTLPVRLRLTSRRGGTVQAGAAMILHRVADGIDTANAKDHQWRISGLRFSPSGGASPSPELMPCRPSAA